jgi:CubicO group peptidase (beta-lactamase class C family)
MSTAQVLQDLLDQSVSEDPAVHNGVLVVGTPDFAWAGATGLSDPDHNVSMLAKDQFQLASISKMFTAAALMTLAEEARIDLDTGIGSYLAPSLAQDLHVFEGHDYGANITPRQLLSHTSGLADFFGDGEPGADGVLPFVVEMRADPDRLWDPHDIVAWTKQNLQAHFQPGYGWHYSDTGLLLAGLIIEQVTGMTLHDFLRQRLFAPLDMAHTFLLFREPPRPSIDGRNVSRAYAGGAAYGETRSVTADWACGGLVSTAGDLTRFLRAFADDLIFRSPETKQQMLSWTSAGEPGVYYGLGVRRFDLGGLGLEGFGELWGHTGFIKSFMLYWPEESATICGTLNQASAQGAFSEHRPVAALVPAVLRELRNG